MQAKNSVPLNDTDGTMGAKVGEACGHCGTNMNQAATVCTGCGARRKVGATKGEISKFVMAGLLIGFFGIGVIVESSSIIVFLLGLVMLSSPVIAPVLYAVLKRGEVRYFRRD